MGRDFDYAQVAEAALAFGGELADGFDVIADKFDAVGGLGIEGKDVEDAAAAGELPPPPADPPPQLPRFHALESMLDQPGGDFFEVGLASHLEQAALPGKLGAIG